MDVGISLAGGSTPGGDGDGTSLGSVFSIIFFLGVFVTIIFSIISSIGYVTLSFYLDLTAPSWAACKARRSRQYCSMPLQTRDDIGMQISATRQASVEYPDTEATAAHACRRNRSEGRRSRRCQSLIEKLKREQARALSSHQYPAESCPVCLEDFRLGSRDARPSAPPLSDDKVRLRQRCAAIVVKGAVRPSQSTQWQCFQQCLLHLCYVTGAYQGTQRRG